MVRIGFGLSRLFAAGLLPALIFAGSMLAHLTRAADAATKDLVASSDKPSGNNGASGSGVGTSNRGGGSGSHGAASDPAAAEAATAADNPLAVANAAARRAQYELVLLRDARVASALGLDAQQRARIGGAASAAGAVLWQLRDVPGAEAATTRAHAAEGLETALAAALRSDQRQRLSQLVLQALGWQTLLADEVRTQLKLTPQQTQRIEEILQADKSTAAAKGKPAAEASQRINALFTTPQRQQLAALLGAQFDFADFPQRAAEAPELRGVEAWINSDPLTLDSLRGKVVVLHFFTFGCINCKHNYPSYLRWQDRFDANRVTLLGIHTPETPGEKELDNVRAAIQKAGLRFPVAVDNGRENWTAWGNHIWPAVYLIDRQGFVRYWWYGELNWQGAEGEKFMQGCVERLMAETDTSAGGRD